MATNPNFQFQTVKRAKCKASIVVEGLSGRGKSGLALTLANALATSPDKVFAVDTENNSLRLFEGIPASNGGVFGQFQVGEFTPNLLYKPTNYLMYRDAAVEAGADVVIFDSISHAWQYNGGILDIVSTLKKTNDRYKRDSYAVWGDDVVVKEKNTLMEMLRDYRCHMISTVRVKEKMEYSTDSSGKPTLTSLGEQQIMQGDMKYEPDLVLQMVAPGTGKHSPIAKIIKSRYAIFEVDDIVEFTPAVCQGLKEYLEEGTSPTELLEKQRIDYIQGIATYLDEHEAKKQIWSALKDANKLAGVKLEEMSLDLMKKLFTQLTAD